MAQQWYYQQGGQELGPIAFRELIELVRDGAIGQGDLVRSSWKADWQAAETVVGLFHMAGRSSEDLVRHFTPPPLPIVPVVEPPLDESGEDIADLAGWTARLQDVNDRPPATAERGLSNSGLPLGPPPSDASMGEGTPPTKEASRSASRPRGESLPPEIAAFFPVHEHQEQASAWSEAIKEAASTVADRRSSKSERPDRGGAGLWSRVYGKIPSSDRWDSFLRSGLRIVPAIIFSTLMALAVDNWSKTESLRFPRRLEPYQEQKLVRRFPLIGECGGNEYYFLIFDLMLATGAATYVAARWVESHAD